MKNNSQDTVEEVVNVNMSNVIYPAIILVISLIFVVFLATVNRNETTDKDTNTVEGSVTSTLSTYLEETNESISDETTLQENYSRVSMDDDPILGDQDTAKVAIVEFSDYECPYCKKYHQETFDKIVKNYVDTGEVIIIYRDFPLSFHNPLATTEAQIAECVRDVSDDEGYYKYSAEIFNNTRSNGSGISLNKLYELVIKLGFNKGEVEECVVGGSYEKEILKDIKDGQSVGINGTPGFIIGIIGSDNTVTGVRVSGAQPYSVFQGVLDNQLKRVNENNGEL